MVPMLCDGNLQCGPVSGHKQQRAERATCPVLVVPSNAELREEPVSDPSEEIEYERDDAGFAND